MKSLIESKFTHEKLPCVILQVSFGDHHRCGYVGVPESHPFFGISYSEEIQFAPAFLKKEMLVNSIESIGIIPALFSDGDTVSPDLLLRAHGGITFSSGTWPGMPYTYPTSTQEPIWWFGFDAAHYNDYELHGRSLSYMERSAKELAAQLQSYSNLFCEEQPK